MNAKGFFLRFDVIRTICRALLVLLMLILFFARSWSLGTFGVVFFAVSVTLCVIGSVLRCPHEYKISEFLSNERQRFEAEVRREHKSFRMGDPLVFYAYAPWRAMLARALGKRLIYPTCLNMMFLPYGEGGTLIVGELSLWEKKKTVKQKILFQRLSVSFLRMDGDAEILAVTLCDNDEERMIFYVRDDHFWRAFLARIKDTCRVTELEFDR